MRKSLAIADGLALLAVARRMLGKLHEVTEETGLLT